MTRCIKIFIILLCLSLLNSCTVKTSYRFLDRLMLWQLEKYVDLKGEQKKQAKQSIDDFHAWHRRTQLSLYANYLEEVKSGMLAGPVSAAYLHKESDKLQDMLDVSMEEFLPTLTQIAQSLSEEQIQEVLDNLQEERNDYQKDYIDDEPKKIQKRRIRDVTRYIGGFFGRFTDVQKQRLIDWEESLAPYEDLMMDQQYRWQNDFLAAMEFQADPEKLRQKLQPLILYRTDSWQPELREKLDTNQALTFNMLADLFNSQTEKQKKKMEKKFDEYINDLRELSKSKQIEP